MPLGSSLTVNGRLTAGAANGLAKLASVEGTLILANGRTTADTPGGGTLTEASGASLVLNHSGTSLSVTGGLNDSGSLNVVNGASLTLTQSMRLNSGSSVNLAGNSTLTVSGNLTNNSASFYTGYDPAYVNGGGDKLTVTGGFTNSGALYMYGGSYSGAGDTLNVTGTLKNSLGATLDLMGNSGDVANVGKLTNSGIVIISKGSTFSVGTGTYTQNTGSTAVTIVDGTLKSTNTSSTATNLMGGSVFGNGGTFSSNVTNGGTFNIGDAALTPGKETITGMYTQTGLGALDIDIGGAMAGTQYDQLHISGAAGLNGTLNLDLINPFLPTIGETFDILNASSVTGTFATVNGTAINGSEHFAVVVNPTNVTLDVVAGPAPPWALGFVDAGGSASPSGTPEPSTLLLLGSGLAGLTAYRRRSKRA